MIISFAVGGDYYHRAADALEARCDALGLEHHIRRLPERPGADWIDYCRLKIGFYREMLETRRGPVAWVDVDTQILRSPEEFLTSSADLTAFLRNFNAFNGFDPALTARLLHPGYLRFAYNQRVLDFLGAAAALERQTKLKVTDDYLFQEALVRHGDALGVMLMRPSAMISNPEAEGASDALFLHRASGNVDTFIDQAVQHSATALDLKRQALVLTRAADHMAERKDHQSAAAVHGYIRALTPDDPRAYSRHLKALRKIKAWEQLDEAHALDAEADEALALEASRSRLMTLIAQKRYDDARALAATFDDRPDLAGFARSRLFRADFDERAEARGLTPRERIATWWWEKPYPGNVGDLLGPYLIERLTGTPPRFAYAKKRVLTVGSIARWGKPGSTIWGSGVATRDVKLEQGVRVTAVRGPVTREVALKSGLDCPEVYGDPAWLLPLVYAPRVDRRHRLGVILHHAHRDRVPPLGAGVVDICVIRDGVDGIETFLREILSCDAIVSTSLHGVIIAHAYGVPVRWAVLPSSARQPHGDGAKFEDYFASLDMPLPQPLDLGSLERIDAALADGPMDDPVRPIDRTRLLEAAPFEVRPEILTASRAPIRRP